MNKKDFPEYRHYCAMKSNCAYKGNCYTENNIQICQSWLGKDGFWTFLNDMGTKPSEKHKLFRINCKGPYNKDNCIWSIKGTERRESKRKQPKTKPIVYKGKEYKNLTALCREFNIEYNRSYYRYATGWDIESVVEEPNQKENNTRKNLNSFFNFNYEKR